MELEVSKRNAKNVRKGNKCEALLCSLLRELGFPAARRQPGSGNLQWALGPEYRGDARAGFVLGEGREPIWQCKSKKSGFSQTRKWLQEADILFLKTDREIPQVVMSWPIFAQLASFIPAANRLPEPKDRHELLRRAAEKSPWAADLLRKIEQFERTNELRDEPPLEDAGESPPPATTETPPF